MKDAWAFCLREFQGNLKHVEDIPSEPCRLITSVSMCFVVPNHHICFSFKEFQGKSSVSALQRKQVKKMCDNAGIMGPETHSARLEEKG